MIKLIRHDTLALAGGEVGVGCDYSGFVPAQEQAVDVPAEFERREICQDDFDALDASMPRCPPWRQFAEARATWAFPGMFVASSRVMVSNMMCSS